MTSDITENSLQHIISFSFVGLQGYQDHVTSARFSFSQPVYFTATTVCVVEESQRRTLLVIQSFFSAGGR